MSNRNLSNPAKRWKGRLEYLNRGEPFDPNPPPQEIHKTANKLKNTNRFYIWGNATHGALGDPHLQLPARGRNKIDELDKPRLVRLGMTENVCGAACGYGFTLFLTKGSGVWGTGVNTSGQIGFHVQKVREDKGPRYSKPLEVLLEPAQIQLPLNKTEKVESLAAGRAHTLLLLDSGQVLSLGSNSYGQCGREVVEGEDYLRSRQVHRMELEDRVVGVECGQDHSLLLTEGGKVMSCGWAADGQTGLGTYFSNSQPREVKGDLNGVRVKKVVGRGDTVLALDSEGQVYGWGNSEYQQLGLVSGEQQVHTPTHLPLHKYGVGKVIDLAAGGTHCMVLDHEGRVWVWGYGLLGLGPGIQSSRQPKEIPSALFGRNALNPDVRVVSVFAGLGHSAAITSAGDLLTWGHNRGGCLGLAWGRGARTRDQTFPLRVATGGRVTKAWLGVDHTLVEAFTFIHQK